MRIGIHVDAVAHRVPGGIPTYVRRLVDALLAAGGPEDYRLLVARSAGGLPPGWPADAVLRARLPLRPLYVAWNLLRRPRVSGLDVVHATNLVCPPGPGALVATVHDDTVERYPELVPRFWRTLYRRGLRIALTEAAVVCTNSQATKDRLVEGYAVAPERVLVTPFAPAVTPGLPAEVSVLDRFGLHGPYILHVSTLEPRKNQTALVRAFAEAAPRLPGHRLVLAGAHGWGAEATKAEIENSGIAERVVLTGPLGPAALAALYAHATAFAMPSLYEGFGMPLAEALAFGVPSVASTDAALREVSDGVALHVEASDEPALAEALVRLCTDAELRARLAVEGPQAAGRFTWTRTADATRAAYRIAAGETVPRGEGS